MPVEYECWWVGSLNLESTSALPLGLVHFLLSPPNPDESVLLV